MSRRALILCVDDNWNGLEERKMLLEESGYEVLVATSGMEALQILSGHAAVDLVLVDDHMPGMAGDLVGST